MASSRGCTDYTGGMVEQIPVPGPAWRVLRAQDCVRTRWKNGLGWTREVARGCLPPDAPSAEIVDGWDWRLSIGEIDADADFSTFHGVDRELTLLSGAGVRLRGADGSLREVLPPHGSARFDGETRLHGERVDGRVEVLNLMWRRDAVAVQSWFRPLVGPMLVFAAPGETWLVHLVAGHARLDRDERTPLLEMGDSVLLSATDARERCLLEGAGAVVLAKLAPQSRGRTDDQ